MWKISVNRILEKGVRLIHPTAKARGFLQPIIMSKTFEVTAVGLCQETYKVTAESEEDARRRAVRGTFDEVITTDPIEPMEVTGAKEVNSE